MANYLELVFTVAIKEHECCLWLHMWSRTWSGKLSATELLVNIAEVDTLGTAD